MMERAALRIYEVTKGMTVEEEVAYWKIRQAEALKAIERPSANRAEEH
jgi:hypothetical protein